jgi:hypothetical protein
MLLRLVLLSFFRDLLGSSEDFSRDSSGCLVDFSGSFSDFQDVLDVDLSSLFIVGELPHRV